MSTGHHQTYPTLSPLAEKWATTALAFMHFAHILDFVIMMPLGPQFMRTFQIGPSKFGLLVASYTFSASVTGITSSFVIDRFDRKRSLFFVYTGFIFGTLLCAFSSNFYQLLVARVIAGSFGGTLGGLILSIIGDLFPPEKRGRATGVVMSAFSIASVIGIPIGLFLASMLNWRIPFFGVALLAVIAMRPAWKILPSMQMHISTAGNKNETTFFSVIKEPAHLKAYAFMFIVMFTGFSIFPYLSPYLVKNVGLTEHQLPLIYFSGGLFTFFTSRYIGILADRHGKNLIFSIVAGLAIIPIFVITNLPPLPLWMIISVTTVFMILLSGRAVPALAMVTGSVHPRARGRFMSINTSIQHLSTSLASFFGGLIIVESPRGTLLHFNTVGGISIVASLIAIFLAWQIEAKG